MSNLGQRLRTAFGVLFKGSIAPFDRIPVEGAGGEAKLRDAYRNSVWVMRALKHVAGPISAVPVCFTLDRAGSEQQVETPELSAWWQAPALGLSFVDFVEASVGWLKLAGECFWILDDTWLLPFREVGQRGRLIVARPDRMRHVVSGGELIGWDYTDAAGHQHRLIPQQVVQLKLWNPYDPWRGLGELEAAMLAAESDYLAGRYQRDLMRNAGDRGPYLVAKNGLPNDQQREQIIAALRAKRAAAGRGDFHPVFLTGDVAVEDPQVQGLDANVVAQRLQNRHEVFIAFGVPASMADVVASYSVGSASDRFRLIEETCMPAASKLAEGIESIARRQTGLANLFAWFDWDEHSVMQQVRRERVDSALKLWGVGMPMRAINDYLRLGLPEFQGWETGYLPFSVAPVASLDATAEPQDPAQSPAYAEGDGTGEDSADAVQQMVRALRGAPVCARANRPAAEIAAWRDHMGKRRETMKRYEAAFNRELLKARMETLRNLERLTPGKSTGQRAGAAADVMFDLGTFRNGLFAAMRKVARGALDTAGKQLFAEIGRDDPFTMPPEAVLQFTRSREDKLGGVADDVHAQIRLQLEEGYKNGETTGELAGRVRAAFNEVSRGRALTIAQTETSAAYGTARQTAMTEAGVEAKRWLASGNDNMRDAHRDANGQTVPVDEPFVVDGEQLMHPGDPHGSPGNVINCHCVAIAVPLPSDS